MGLTRLDCLLANLGYCFRSRTREFLKSEQVCLEGRRLLDPSARVDRDHVTVAGETLDPPALYILLHKPLGYICSHKEHGSLVYDLIPPRWTGRKPRITSVGRLDKDTTGLLLLSDDGVLVHRLTNPKHHVPRVYRAVLAKPLAGNEAAVFASGTLMLPEDRKPLQPAEMQALSPREARLTLREGRYHQVRRMFEAMDNAVTELHRESFGPLTLAGLAPGEWRLLNAAEVEGL
ncbi:MAG: 16S rRNA pseudouridine(516) synthase [Tepidisphaeraceae bacterium]|jgi:16S rRNA pseudouridine516 synthase